MELPDVGDHCALKECSRLDFLPFRCEKCKWTYCLDHKTPESHSCPKLAEEEENGESGGDPSSAPIVDKVSYGCSYSKINCKKRELTPVVCPKCRLPFCLAHRHPPDHECPVHREEERLKWEIENKTTKPTTKTTTTPTLNQRPLRNAKARQMAAKVALMKMKLHAKGDASVPQTERVYFWLAMPRRGSTPKEDEEIEAGRRQRIGDIPMFFCDRWSLGRAVDFVASHQKLRNANNVASARKLRLFRHEDGAPLTDSSMTVQLVVEEKIAFSGSALVLEYVDPEDDGKIDVDPALYPL